MSDELNGGSGQYNDNVPETTSYSEYHGTSELHSERETWSFSEYGDTAKKASAPVKTLTTSRGMNEALKYSTQVATVVKAVAVVTVAAVVVMAPLIDAGSSVKISFFDVSAQDTYIDYYIVLEDYQEGMDLTVTLHNDFVSRTHPIESGSISQREDGLQPGMEYKITVREGKKLVEERSVWTSITPHASILILGDPVYDRNAGTVTVEFEYNDPTGRTSAISGDVYGPGGSRIASCDPADGILVIDVSGITGYDSGLVISALYTDDTVEKLKIFNIALYVGDSEIGINGFSLGSTDRDVLNLDMNYNNADGLYSDLIANVYVDDVLYGTDCTIANINTNPSVTLDSGKTIESNSSDIRVVISYKEHSYTSTVLEPKSVEFTGKLYPNIEMKSGPTFQRSTGLMADVVFDFTYNDPNSVTESLVVKIKNVADVAEQTFSPTDGSVTVDVTTLVGYDSTITIYSVDSTSARTPIYQDDIALYGGDSTISLSGIHLEGEYRDRVYLDMEYEDRDSLFSDILATVIVNGTPVATDNMVYNIDTDPVVVFVTGGKITSTSDSVEVTISYSAHSHTDITPVPQTDLTYSGSVPFVRPMATVSNVLRTADDEVSLSVALDGSSDKWSDFKLSGYYIDDSDVRHDFTNEADVADIADVAVAISSMQTSVPTYNVTLYLTMTCTQTIGSTVTTETVFSDETVPTIILSDITRDVDISDFEFSFKVSDIKGIDMSDPHTFAVTLKYEDPSGHDPTHVYSGGSFTAAGQTMTMTVSAGEYASGNGYITIVCDDAITIMNEASIGTISIPQG